jgi:DNA repair protein RecN (Recombination protein N)
MLATLRVRNFVLIDQLELHLGAGLNVLTGETGAGKSIVVDALGLLLGGRASPDVIRSGAAEAEVEALFEVPAGSGVAERLPDAGGPSATEVVIRRVVTQAGRSRAYLNGRLCTVAELAQIGPLLVDIASQHESVSLTDPATHLDYLDAFAKLAPEREAVAREVDALKKIVQEAREAAERARGRAEREAFLRYQLSAIEDVAPTAGEDETLLVERGRLRNADRIVDAARRGSERLSEGESTIADELARIVTEVRGAATFDPELAPVADALDSARAEIVEAGRTLERRAAQVDADPARLEEIESRLFAIEKLKRQHGATLGDVLAARDRLHQELTALAGAETRASELDGELEKRLQVAGTLARALSKKRARAATTLGESISRELALLGMGTAKVVVEVAPLEGADPSERPLVVSGARLSRDGIDRVEFLIAPNKGVEPRPLRKVASGGELSRALLALKRVLADGAPAGTYVFDEVDTGVGGAVAESIGRALADVARHRQVLCITHLAPIAAFGSTHFVVEKGVSGEKTTSTLTEVKGKARVQEIARMISGATVTESGRKAAVEMLASAQIAPAPAPAPRKSGKAEVAASAKDG